MIILDVYVRSPWACTKYDTYHSTWYIFRCRHASYRSCLSPIVSPISDSGSRWSVLRCTGTKVYVFVLVLFIFLSFYFFITSDRHRPDTAVVAIVERLSTLSSQLPTLNYRSYSQPNSSSSSSSGTSAYTRAGALIRFKKPGCAYGQDHVCM